MLSKNEKRVWDLIKKYPGELSFILQEKNYAMYVETFDINDDIPITEEEFNLVKDYFTKMGKQ